MSVPRLQMRGITRDFGAVRAVDDVTFTVAAGEVHALCGHNGAGKSTLLNILAGVVGLQAGALLLDGAPLAIGSPRDAQQAGIARVDQELSLVGELSVAENMALGGVGSDRAGRRGALRRRTAELLELVGLGDVAPSTRVAELSLGRRQLVEIARALGRDARVLILDEPTATLTDVEIERVFAAVRGAAASGCAVVFVSHRLGEVLALCDRVTVMRDGALTHSGATAGTSADDLVVAMLGEEPAPAARHASTGDHKRELIVEGLTVSGRLSGFSAALRGGRVHGLAGQVGSGASEVLRALAGLEPAARGRVALDGSALGLGSPVRAARRGIAYAANDRKSEGLFLGRSVAENLTATRLTAVAGPGRRGAAAVRAAAEPLAEMATVTRGRLADPVTQLSGGNQQKVLVARSLGRDDVAVLLVDEPTRGVDVGGRAAIHELLRSAARSGMVVVFASTELEELEELADSTITMRQGRVIGRYDGPVSKQQVLGDLTHREVAA